MDRPASGERPAFEVEFVVQDEEYPFVRASADGACTVELAEMIARSGDRYAEFFNVVGANPEDIVALAAGHETVDVTLLTEYDDGGFFEFVVSENCPAHRLAQLGALPRDVWGADGEGRIVAEVPPHRDVSAVVEAFLDAEPDAELVTKRRTDSVTPVFTSGSEQELLHRHLTDRQREVLEAALEAGYYEWPRECTGEDVASELGITSATFSEHVNAAERKLLAALFDGAGSDRSDAPGG